MNQTPNQKRKQQPLTKNRSKTQSAPKPTMLFFSSFLTVFWPCDTRPYWVWHPRTLAGFVFFNASRVCFFAELASKLQIKATLSEKKVFWTQRFMWIPFSSSWLIVLMVLSSFSLDLWQQCKTWCLAAMTRRNPRPSCGKEKKKLHCSLVYFSLFLENSTQIAASCFFFKQRLRLLCFALPSPTESGQNPCKKPGPRWAQDFQQWFLDRYGEPTPYFVKARWSGKR